jgi:hypothetical protein
LENKKRLSVERIIDENHGREPLPNAYSQNKVEKKRRLCMFPKKRTKINPCPQYPHVESTTLMTENIESEKHWCNVD